MKLTNISQFVNDYRKFRDYKELKSYLESLNYSLIDIEKLLKDFSKVEYYLTKSSEFLNLSLDSNKPEDIDSIITVAELFQKAEHLEEVNKVAEQLLNENKNFAIINVIFFIVIIIIFIIAFV